jgi:hypothetical protein
MGLSFVQMIEKGKTEELRHSRCGTIKISRKDPSLLKGPERQS